MRPSARPLAAALVALASPAAWANGQTTHVWISREARQLVADGALGDLVRDPALEAALVHGTMFPDGGYPLGHPYGEAAHWEPFQGAYLAWIRRTYGPPYDDEEARQHVAFLLGLASHGMADQTFDAHYQNRSQGYDGALGWAAGDSMDEATDFEWAWLTGPQEVPERFVPAATLVEVFAERGIDVDEATLDEGQDLLELAIGLVGLGSQAEEGLVRHREGFPWATSHMQDPDLPGTPAREAEVIALYWAEVWGRLHDLQPEDVILHTHPAEGGWVPSTDPESPDSRITITFRRSLHSDDIVPEAFLVEGPEGPLAVQTWLFYGTDSHIVHLVPVEPWPTDAELVVTVRAGLPDRLGGVLAADATFTVTTEAPPPEDSGCRFCEDEGADIADLEGTDEPKSRCEGCASGPGQGLGAGLLGLLALVVGWRRRRG
ncbi:MAG: zinc dependent phospholipase C family protein [Deltaproteobacteria bacterium]|nr:zinc dependent phospholipase C family protein [Deltaproteobacteria bacterium]